MPACDVTVEQHSRSWQQQHYRAVRNDMHKIEEPVIYRNEQGILVSEEECSWEVAERKILRGDLEFGRSPENAQNYKQRLHEIQSEWDSIDSYTKHRFLNYAFKCEVRHTIGSGSQNQVVKYVPASATAPDKSFVVALNDFPYNLAPEITHYIVWSTNSSAELAEYESVLKRKFDPSDYEVLVFENLHHNKSVKSVAHVHAYVRRRQEHLSKL